MARVRVPVDSKKLPKAKKTSGAKSTKTKIQAKPAKPVESIEPPEQVMPVSPVEATNTTQQPPSLAVWLNANKKRIVYVLLACIVLLLIITLINDRNRLSEQVNQLQNNGSTASNQSGDNQQAEAQQLTAEIGKYLQLPNDEQPVVATVEDADKIKTQSFFKDAVNGDKVILYSKSGKAILYRPKDKKVIEVAPINQNSKDALNSTQITQ